MLVVCVCMTYALSVARPKQNFGPRRDPEKQGFAIVAYVPEYRIGGLDFDFVKEFLTHGDSEPRYFNQEDFDTHNIKVQFNDDINDEFRNALKKMNLLIENKKKDEALKFLPKLNSELMKIAKTGIIKKQNASRNVSRITKKISTI